MQKLAYICTTILAIFFLTSCGYALHSKQTISANIFPIKVSGNIPNHVAKNHLSYPWVQQLFKIDLANRYSGLQNDDAIIYTDLVFESEIVEENKVFSDTSDNIIKNLGLIVKISASNKDNKKIWHQLEFSAYKNYIMADLSLENEQKRYALLKQMADEIIEQIKQRLNATKDFKIN